MDTGTVCVKLTGREAGEKAVVVDSIDKNFVLVAGPNIRRRRCNLRHLKPLEKLLDIKPGASNEEVSRALKVAFPEEAKPVPKKVEKPREKPAKPKKEKAPSKEKKAPKEEKPPKPKEEKKERAAKAPKKKAKKEGK